VNLRERLLVAGLALVLLPLAGLSFALRQGMESRLSKEYTDRVETQLGVVEQDLQRRNTFVADRLHQIAVHLAGDNGFRLAVVDGVATYRKELLSLAERRMALAGLDMLQIQDASGKILSSGHYPEEFDRGEPDLPRLLARTQGVAFAEARRPEGPFLILARVETVQVAGRPYHLVGGIRAGEDFLAELTRGPQPAVSLIHADQVISSDPDLAAVLASRVAARGVRGGLLPVSDYFLRERTYPYFRSGGPGPVVAEQARILVSYPKAPLAALRRRLDIWLLGILAASALGMVVLAVSLSYRVSKPIEDLATRVERMDLDRLEATFPAAGRDEIARLSRFLNEMTFRLRSAAAELRRAEHRATLGDLARQVNHDIRNGIVPIRNTLRHLNQVAASEPGELPRIFAERQATITAGLEYLEELANRYARLSPPTVWERVDVIEVARHAGGGYGTGVALDLAEGPLWVVGDPVKLRRILDNLIANARDAAGPDGSVKVIAAAEDDLVRLAVEDDGPGIPAEVLDRVQEDFFTTKKTGAGLGLSIVRRLVADMEGEIRIASGKGTGTRVTVTLPAADKGAN